jgi:hypothetical protein
MTGKTAISFIILAFVFLAAISFIAIANKTYEREIRVHTRAVGVPVRSSPKQEWAYLEIQFDDGSARRFAVEIGSEPYPFSVALASAAEIGRFEFGTDKKGHLSRLAGVANVRGTSWRVYRNSALVEAPLDELVISAGDRYLLRFEK